MDCRASGPALSANALAPTNEGPGVTARDAAGGEVLGWLFVTRGGRERGAPKTEKGTS